MRPSLQVEHSLGYVEVSASCSEMQSKAYLTVEQYFPKFGEWLEEKENYVIEIQHFQTASPLLFVE